VPMSQARCMADDPVLADLMAKRVVHAPVDPQQSTASATKPLSSDESGSNWRKLACRQEQTAIRIVLHLRWPESRSASLQSGFSGGTCSSQYTRNHPPDRTEPGRPQD
jgi:hypothetical protein